MIESGNFLNLLSNTPTLSPRRIRLSAETLPRQGGGVYVYILRQGGGNIYLNPLPWREGQGEGV